MNTALYGLCSTCVTIHTLRDYSVSVLLRGQLECVEGRFCRWNCNIVENFASELLRGKWWCWSSISSLIVCLCNCLTISCNIGESSGWSRCLPSGRWTGGKACTFHTLCWLQYNGSDRLVTWTRLSAALHRGRAFNIPNCRKMGATKKGTLTCLQNVWPYLSSLTSKL